MQRGRHAVEQRRQKGHEVTRYWTAATRPGRPSPCPSIVRPWCRASRTCARLQLSHEPHRVGNHGGPVFAGIPASWVESGVVGGGAAQAVHHSAGDGGRGRLEGVGDVEGGLVAADGGDRAGVEGVDAQDPIQVALGEVGKARVLEDSRGPEEADAV